MEYQIQNISKMTIQGISIRTDNNEGMSVIPELWETFFKQDVLGQINNNANESCVFALYTDYEGDENGKYTLVIGGTINTPGEQKNLTTVHVPGGRYAVFTAPSKEKVVETWQKVWQSGLPRTFLADFEQYDLTTDEVKVFIGIQ
jgi:predicted transcriptional regulator YdeE